jgi:putative intracellular protease/amidase
MKGMAALPVVLIATMLWFTAGTTPALAATVAPPANFTVTVTPGPTGTVATFNWAATGTPTSFTIQKASFTTGLVTSTVAGTQRTATQAGLVKGNTYHYRIRTNTAAGSSAYTPVVDVTVP